MRDGVLAGHIVAGVLGLVVGPVAWCGRGVSGRRWWVGYDICIAAVAVSAGWLVALEPERLWWLLPIAAATWGATIGGRWIAARRPESIRLRVHLLGGSYFSLVTGLGIGVSGSPLAWVLPALIAQPVLFWTDHRLTHPRHRSSPPHPPSLPLEVTMRSHLNVTTDAVVDDRRRAARERVDAAIWLTVHALAFVGVNVGIAVAQGFQPQNGVFWGWGIGLVAHAALVLGRPPRWRERLVERELKRLA